MPGPRMGRAVQDFMVELRFAALRKMRLIVGFVVFGWAHLLALQRRCATDLTGKLTSCSPCCSDAPTFWLMWQR